jgi:hypothetical protein
MNHAVVDAIRSLFDQNLARLLVGVRDTQFPRTPRRRTLDAALVFCRRRQDRKKMSALSNPTQHFLPDDGILFGPLDHVQRHFGLSTNSLYCLNPPFVRSAELERQKNTTGGSSPSSRIIATSTGPIARQTLLRRARCGRDASERPTCEELVSSVVIVSVVCSTSTTWLREQVSAPYTHVWRHRRAYLAARRCVMVSPNRHLCRRQMTITLATVDRRDAIRHRAAGR